MCITANNQSYHSFRVCWQLIPAYLLFSSYIPSLLNLPHTRTAKQVVELPHHFTRTNSHDILQKCIIKMAKRKKVGTAKKQKVVTLEMKLESGCDVG